MTERDKSTVLLEHYFEELKLPTMLRNMQRLPPPAKKIDPTSRSISCAWRRGSSWTGRNGLLRGASKMPLPVIKTIDTYDFSAQPRS